jgi:hypothetical protein
MTTGYWIGTQRNWRDVDDPTGDPTNYRVPKSPAVPLEDAIQSLPRSCGTPNRTLYFVFSNGIESE